MLQYIQYFSWSLIVCPFRLDMIVYSECRKTHYLSTKNNMKLFHFHSVTGNYKNQPTESNVRQNKT